MIAHCPLRITAIVVGLILATLPWLSATAHAQPLFDDPISDAIDGMSQAAGAPVKASRSKVNGLVTFMSTPAAPIDVSLPPTANAEARARAFLHAHGHAFGIDAAADVAHVRSHKPDAIGRERARFQQLHKGVPVTGGEIMVHLRGPKVVGVTAKILDLPDPVDTNPTVSADEARAAAETFIADRFGLAGIVWSQPRLEVFSRGMLEARRTPVHLA